MAARDHRALGPLSQDARRLSEANRQRFRQGLAGCNVDNSGFEQVTMHVRRQFPGVEVVPQEAAGFHHEPAVAT